MLSSIRLPKLIVEHKLLTILAVGILARVILMPISAHPFDVYAWNKISLDIIENGPFKLQFFPPLWGHYMMIPIAYAYNWLSGIFPSWAGAFPLSSLPNALNPDPPLNIQFVPGFLFNFVVKVPFLISDILVTLLLYKTVEEITANRGFAQKAAFFWFLNPFVIWISAGWGMWDTLPALFSLAAFYLLLKKKIAFSAVFLSLGVVSKLYPLLFLVPIAFYFLKSSPNDKLWKDCASFFSVFTVASVLLFLPYIGAAANFVVGLFVPISSGIVGSVGAVGIPISLNYWSLFSLNLVFNIPLNASFVYQATLASTVLLAVFLMLVYWKTSKMTFQKPASDLITAMLLSVLALFLSYRVICEQWFVWVLPFLIVLCVGGRIRSVFYWGASLVALDFVFLNCFLPFFFLPVAPWIGNNLLWMVYSAWSVWQLRIVSLALLGCLFSLLMVYLVMKLTKVGKK